MKGYIIYSTVYRRAGCFLYLCKGIRAVKGGVDEEWTAPCFCRLGRELWIGATNLR